MQVCMVLNFTNKIESFKQVKKKKFFSTDATRNVDMYFAYPIKPLYNFLLIKSTIALHVWQYSIKIYHKKNIILPMKKEKKIENNHLTNFFFLFNLKYYKKLEKIMKNTV